MSGIVPVAYPRRRPEWLRAPEGWPTFVAAFTAAAVLALLAVIFDWRGSDLPAQVFRADLVKRDGFVVWNSHWFGGHATLAYSVISPWLSAITGPVFVGAVSGIAAAVLFERILQFAYGHASWVGALWFTLGTATNLIVGRVTFALGVALGLAAVYALQRNYRIAAVVCAVLCSLASPLAGAFLAIAAFGWALAQRDRRLLALVTVAAALMPLAVVAALFPNRGTEPYEAWMLIWDLALCALVAGFAGHHRALRWGLLLYAVAAVSCFMIATPVGGNISRFGQYVGGPILACALLPRRRLLLAALAIPLVIWQWFPTIDTIAYARTDPSTKSEYYAPLISWYSANPGTIGRVEIPSTYRHWEAAYAAPHMLLARGWERQLDIAYNPIFYSEPLTETTYREWLIENGVEYVALPNAQLDDSSLAERDLLLAGVPYLDKMWSNDDWKVWRFTGFHGLVDGQATLDTLEPDQLTLTVAQAGDVTVRVRSSAHWKVRDDAGCVESTSDGWTRLRNLRPGPVVVEQSLRGTPCPA